MPRKRTHGLRPEIVAALILALAPMSASADDSFERGQSAGRVLLVLRSPYACAIAVINDRCRADIAAYFKEKTDADFRGIPKAGPHPLSGLNAFVQNGDPSGLDPALAYINTNLAPAGEWARSPGDAALFDAGTETVLWPAAMGNMAGEYLSIGPILDLAAHRSRIPPGTLPASFDRLAPAKSEGGTTGIPSNIREITTAFVVEINRLHPPAAMLNVAQAAGIRADALHGVAYSTLAELIDNPPWLAQADAQRFAHELLSGMTIDSADTKAQLAECDRAVTISASFDRGDALKACVRSTTSYLQSLPVNRRRAFLLGTAAAQAAYNAAVLRSEPSAAEYLRVVSSFDDLDATLPAFASPRARAKSVASNDWKSQFELGLQLVHAIADA